MAADIDKPSLLLLALLPAGTQSYTPVQVQKLLFLIQKKLPRITKEIFDFQPYDYGPFDKSIYEELEKLSKLDLIEIQKPANANWKLYGLTVAGLEKAKLYQSKLTEGEVNCIGELSKFVRQLSFSQLVSSIYKAYPEMSINSVFKE